VLDYTSHTYGFESNTYNSASQMYDKLMVDPEIRMVKGKVDELDKN
jgi:hypothetical protein